MTKGVELPGKPGKWEPVEWKNSGDLICAQNRIQPTVFICGEEIAAFRRLPDPKPMPMIRMADCVRSRTFDMGWGTVIDAARPFVWFYARREGEIPVREFAHIDAIDEIVRDGQSIWKREELDERGGAISTIAARLHGRDR